MKTRRRTAVAATAGIAVVLLTAQQAAAGSGSVYAGSGGIAKTAATYGQSGVFKLCANLLTGYKGVASMGGNSVSDFSAGNGPSCVDIYNVTSGRSYQLTATWYGNGGGYDTNSTSVVAN